MNSGRLHHILKFSFSVFRVDVPSCEALVALVWLTNQCFDDDAMYSFFMSGAMAQNLFHHCSLAL
jgi:hypothetical protein